MLSIADHYLSLDTPLLLCQKYLLWFTWQLSTLDSLFNHQNINFSGTGSFLTKGSSNSSSLLPYFAVQSLSLRILLVFAGWHLSGNSVCVILPVSQFTWPAGFPRSQLSKPLLWNIRGQCCGSLLQESDLQSPWLMLSICSWEPMAAGQRGFLWFPPQNTSRDLPTQGRGAAWIVWGPSMSSVLMGLHHSALLCHHGTLQNVFYITSLCATQMMKKWRNLWIEDQEHALPTQLRWFNG